MKRVATTFIPPVAVDRSSGTPMHKQLYDWFRSAIIDGRICAGHRVPSTRGLAAELKISRMPVVNAFEQLLAEGYFETFAGSGTRVAHSIPDTSLSIVPQKRRKNVRHSVVASQARSLSRRGAALATPQVQVWSNSQGPFRVSLPAVDHFPTNIWSKLVNRHARMQSKRVMAYGNAMGHLSLRKAIAEYVGASRGVRCEASQIIVTTGSQQALQIAAHVLLNPGDEICVEDPGYPGARQAFAMAGARLIPIPVDVEGMIVSELPRRNFRARVAYVTPSHQYPLGVTMSAARRMSLLDWTERFGGWVIEDDYDSEYRFDSRPVAALQGLDSNSSVIYIGTFSKVMFPALRLGYIIVPLNVVSAFAAARDAADIFSSTLLQAVMTDFIREGHFARHIRRMRILYGDRRSLLVNALAMHLGDKIEVVGAEAGMHLVALLETGVNDVEISRRAALAGVSAMPLSECYLETPRRGGIILGYGGTNKRQIEEGTRTLTEVLRPEGVGNAGVRPRNLLHKA